MDALSAVLLEQGELENFMVLKMLTGRDPIERFKFNLEEITNTKCKDYFRFDKSSLPILKEALGLPDEIICYNKTKVSGLEGLCILLRRFAYPNRLGDLCSLFGRPVEELSMIINKVVNIIFDGHSHRLHDLNQNWINPEEFAASISAKGCPMHRIWAFIDGTVRPICRPTRYQQSVFNGHKRTHALKYQSVMAPNGLIVDLFGPIEGRRHDSALLHESRLLERLDCPKFRNYSIYGDPAYPLRPQLIVPYKGAALTAEQRQFNMAMSNVRESVEWGFGAIARTFAFLDFKKNLKLYLQPIGQYYPVAVILMNCYTCMYGNQVSQYFGIEPPTLQEYLL